MTLKEYKTELNNIFRRNTRNGFSDWRLCGRLAYEVENFLGNASNELLGELRDKELFDLVCAAFLKWGKTDKDDSAGETQGFVYCSAFETWEQIYQREHPDIPHKKMMDWFMKKLDGSVIDYMEDYLYDYLMAHFTEPELLNKKLIFVNKKIAEKEELTQEQSWKRYQVIILKRYILQIYGEQKRPIEEIRDYADNLKDNESKELLAKIELSYGNRDECIALYKELADVVDGKWDRNDYNGKLKDLYKQFGCQNEYEAMVRKLLYIKIGDMDIWDEYKSMIPETDWQQTTERLFAEFSPIDCRPLKWYEAEGRYDLIMSCVENVGTAYLKEYEGELSSRYPDRCLAVLVKAADISAENGKKRSDYRRIAKFLKWMRRYPGGAKQAAELANLYRQRYPRRSAMIDELRGI